MRRLLFKWLRLLLERIQTLLLVLGIFAYVNYGHAIDHI